jgi:hypothetical protein
MPASTDAMARLSESFSNLLAAKRHLLDSKKTFNGIRIATNANRYSLWPDCI